MVTLANRPDLPAKVLCLIFNKVGFRHHYVHLFLKKTSKLGINEGAALLCGAKYCPIRHLHLIHDAFLLPIIEAGRTKPADA
jgi:hypothetical protein